MARKQNPIRSDIAWSNRERIVVRGKDLPNEVIGHMNLGDFAFLQLTGRSATPDQSRLFNAILVTLVEHGLTPSAIAARLTYAGAPESMQAAVAAGLCGLGSVFVGSMEGAARLLYEALPKGTTGADLPSLARDIVARERAAKRILPGMGHPIHKPVDPRAPRLFALAAECGMAGDYTRLIQLVAEEAERMSGKSLPVNATGAIGAICCEFGFPVAAVRGFGVMARAVGLVGHILEESERPMAQEIWHRTEDEASAHMRPPG
ncbi:MAG: citryl-CoA lyase [Rhodospirillales bacterium]|nr:citryl-CoA lyase [Rhodospirillales bacterium]